MNRRQIQASFSDKLSACLLKQRGGEQAAMRQAMRKGEEQRRVERILDSHLQRAEQQQHANIGASTAHDQSAAIDREQVKRMLSQHLQKKISSVMVHSQSIDRAQVAAMLTNHLQSKMRKCKVPAFGEVDASRTDRKRVAEMLSKHLRTKIQVARSQQADKEARDTRREEVKVLLESIFQNQISAPKEQLRSRSTKNATQQHSASFTKKVVTGKGGKQAGKIPSDFVAMDRKKRECVEEALNRFLAQRLAGQQPKSKAKGPVPSPPPAPALRPQGPFGLASSMAYELQAVWTLAVVAGVRSWVRESQLGARPSTLTVTPPPPPPPLPSCLLTGAQGPFPLPASRDYVKRCRWSERPEAIWRSGGWHWQPPTERWVQRPNEVAENRTMPRTVDNHLAQRRAIKTHLAAIRAGRSLHTPPPRPASGRSLPPALLAAIREGGVLRPTGRLDIRPRLLLAVQDEIKSPPAPILCTLPGALADCPPTPPPMPPKHTTSQRSSQPRSDLLAAIRGGVVLRETTQRSSVDNASSLPIVTRRQQLLLAAIRDRPVSGPALRVTGCLGLHPRLPLDLQDAIRGKVQVPHARLASPPRLPQELQSQIERGLSLRPPSERSTPLELMGWIVEPSLLSGPDSEAAEAEELEDGVLVWD